MLDVLIDMTALNTPSRERGIGRYVHNLCRALATRDRWAADDSPDNGVNTGALDGASPGANAGIAPASALTIAGLVRHRGPLAGAVDPFLEFAGDPRVRVGTWQYQRHKLERRLFLGSLARRTGARLLHLPDPPGTPLDQRQPRIVTCHDLIPLVLAKRYLLPLPGARALQRARDIARYRTARRVIAISQATRNDLVEHLGIDPDRIDVVYSGVEHERFTARPEPGERSLLQDRLGFESPFLLCLGASDVRKNLPLLIAAYAESGVARDVRLVFAGPLSNPRRARLESVARVHGVTQQVRILGYVSDALLVALYRHCLAYVFPSSYEGFGLPILEAMACGAPTLTSRLSAIGEVAGDAALLLDTLDAEGLARGITRIVSDTELRFSLRERGLAHVKAFTWQRCAQQTLACYRRALEAH